jgi:hypothetical protein
MISPRVLGRLAGLLFCSLLLWLGLMIAHAAQVGAVVTVEDAVGVARDLSALHYANYLNAVVFTGLTTALLAALYPYLRPTHPVLARVGVVFVPVYSLLNLVAYASQVTVLPLLASALDGAHGSTYAVLVAEATQLRPTSVVGQLNGLAYAIIGIPSAAYGVALQGRGALARVAGCLLIANAVACVVGVAGVVAGHAALGLGSLVGGVLYTAAVPLLWLHFRREARQSGATTSVTR